MKNRFFLIILVLFIKSCDCSDNELPIIDIPDLFLAEAFIDRGLYIKFSHPVDTSSLHSNNLIIVGDNTNYSGSFILLNDTTILIPICEINCIMVCDVNFFRKTDTLAS